MALRSLLVSILVLAAAMATKTADAQLGLLNGLLGLIRIQGTLFCTLNGSMGLNGTSTPVFPNALVQLQCGGNNIASATTNQSGAFSILLDPVNSVLSSLLNSCNLVVNTPLATCNATLPAVGALLSPLQFVETTLVGLLNIANITPAGFKFSPPN